MAFSVSIWGIKICGMEAADKRLSGFLYKLFTAFGAGDGDGAFAPGDAHLLAAAGAVKIPVIPVPEALEEHEKFPVFLVPPVGVPGKGAENCQKQQNIGQK